MKTYKVYELIDQQENIVYVGVSHHPHNRLIEHTRHQPLCAGKGRFYGRTDLSVRIHSEHPTRKEALKIEGVRKLELGIEWTEFKRNSQIGKITGKRNVESGHWQKIKSLGPNASHKIIRSCPHCSREIKGNSYFQHERACRLQTTNSQQT